MQWSGTLMCFNKCLYLWKYKHYMSNEHLLIDHHQSLPYPCLPVPSHAQKVTDFFSIISLHFLEFYVNGSCRMYSLYLTFLSQFILHGWVTLLNPSSVDEHLIFPEWLTVTNKTAVIIAEPLYQDNRREASYQGHRAKISRTDQAP